MATHDYSIANQSFPATRTDLNNVLAAIKSSNSTAIEPSTSLVEGQLWWDSTNNILKVYNGTTFTEVKTGSITAADIDANAVGSSEIAANAVTASEIAANAVGASELNVVDNGVSGQFLKSDGDGTFSWGSVTAGTGLDSNNGTLSVEPDLRDSITHIGRDSNDFIEFGTTTTSVYLDGAERARFINNGDFHADGNIVGYSATISDQRLKSAISKVSGALEKVYNLNGVEFTRTDSGIRSAGVIAQEVEKVLPQAVIESQLPLHTLDSEVYKTVDYNALHSLYIEAIKELKVMVEQQAKEIKELKNT